jgi:hypothetical protein
MSDISIAGSAASGAPFRLGAALGKAFTLFGRQFGKFLLLALIPMIALLFFTLLLRPGGPLAGARVPNSFAFASYAVLAGILTFVLQIIAQATTLYGAFQEMRAQPFTIRQSLNVGFRRALPVIGVALLGALLAALGAILLLVPGIIIACMLYVAVPVCVIEKRGVIGSLDRSAKLTKGYRWSIFGLLLLVVVGAAIGGMIVGVAGKVVLGRSGVSLILGQVLNFGRQVVTTAFGAVLVAVVYHDLRAAKEGIDIDNLANVFD